MPYSLPKTVETSMLMYEKIFNQLPATGLFLYSKVSTLVAITSHLEHIIDHPDENPWPRLEQAIQQQISVLASANDIAHEVDNAKMNDISFGEHERTKPLFEQAWTTYSDPVYDHSVTLVEERLKMSGFDHNWFSGKECFDGGCGTGRLALAMAKMGAKRVVAMDFGGKSLAFFKKQLDRMNIQNVEIVEGDVTDLSRFRDEEFDFVATNGVLHHTPRCLEGMDDHYRVTKNGGIFWIYLYGADGFYWDIYDRLKVLVGTLEVSDVTSIMKQFSLREGFIYTFLDNVFAFRSYYLESEILERMGALAPLKSAHQGGPAIFDTPSKYLATKFGKDILGPEGEIRIVIEKLGHMKGFKKAA